MKKLIVMAAGASGGHIMPALALKEELEREYDLLFVGCGRPIEKKIYQSESVDYRVIESAPVLGKGFLGLLKLAFRLPKSLFVCLKLYYQKRPSLVVGFGGFPCFIPGVAAFLSGIPFVLQEQNGKMGLANKVLSKLAKIVFVSPSADVPVSEKKVIRVGNPVRQKFRSLPLVEKPESGLRVLFLGGSQGARSINNLWLDSRELFASCQVETIIQTGGQDYERVVTEVGGETKSIAAYFSDIEDKLAWADLIVCRAGAMTVAEISAVGRAAIYVPLSIAAGHQAENIKEQIEAGAAWSLEDNEELRETFDTLFRWIIDDPEEIARRAEVSKTFSEVDGQRNAVVIAKSLKNQFLDV